MKTLLEIWLLFALDDSGRFIAGGIMGIAMNAVPALPLPRYHSEYEYQLWSCKILGTVQENSVLLV